MSVRDDLREVISEGRALLKDFSAERKRVEELLKLIPQITHDTIAERLEEEVSKLSDATLRAIAKSEEGIMQRFEKLAELMMGSRHRGDPTLHQLIERLGVIPPGIPFEVTVEGLTNPSRRPPPDGT